MFENFGRYATAVAFLLAAQWLVNNGASASPVSIKASEFAQKIDGTSKAWTIDENGVATVGPDTGSTVAQNDGPFPESAELRFDVALEPGTYGVAVYGAGADSSGDSIWIGVGYEPGEHVAVDLDVDGWALSALRQSSTEGGPVASFAVRSKATTLSVWIREDGAAWSDLVLIPASGAPTALSISGGSLFRGATYSANTGSTVTLSWGAPDTGSAVDAYDVKASNLDRKTIIENSVPGTTLSWPFKVPSVGRWDLCVRARNQYGASDWGCTTTHGYIDDVPAPFWVWANVRPPEIDFDTAMEYRP